MNLNEQIITVKEMPFIFDFNSAAVMEADASAVTAGNYAGALYQMENNSYANHETGIVPNFPGDEAEFYYITGMVRSGVAISNPSETVPIRGVIAEIDESETGLLAGTFLLNTPAGRVSMRELGTLIRVTSRISSGWLSTTISNYQATLEEADADGQFTATFPEGVARQTSMPGSAR